MPRHARLLKRTKSKLILAFSLALGLAAAAAGATWVSSPVAEASTAAQGAGQSAAKKPAVASAAASAALSQLQAGGAQVKSNVSDKTGAYDFVRAARGSVLVSDNASAKPEERAHAFLREHGALIGMNDAERALVGGGAASASTTSASVLQAAKTTSDETGGTHVRLDQFYRGLPVFGAQVLVHMNAQGITGVNGNFVPNIKIGTTPTITAAQANATALRQQTSSAPLSVVKTELAVYHMGLLEGYRGASVLAYNVEVTTPQGLRQQVWINAKDGSVINRIQLQHQGLDRKIYTPQYNPLFVVRSEGQPYTPGPEPGTSGADPINNLYLFAGQTYNMFASAFGRDSYDGAGHTMHSVYLVNEICPNAYWNGISTNYCPDFDADDVVAHEWGHAYTQFTHNLIYSYQSGGLNEAYSDIWGETLDILNGVDAEGGSNNAQPLPNGQRWQVGDDVPSLNREELGILRDMWDPGRYNNPDKVSSPNYGCGAGDVHNTSGVPGHAFALLVDGTSTKPGGMVNGQSIDAIGFVRATHIYYHAMTNYQTATTNFAQHADALEQSCDDLMGDDLNGIKFNSATGTVSSDKITAHTCQQVAKAMLAVEMREPAPCTIIPLLEPGAPDACDGAADVFTEDWETGMDGWTLTSTPASAANQADWNDSSRSLRDWYVNSSPPGGHTGSVAHARNNPLGEPGGGTCGAGGDYSGQFTIDSPTITIPAGGDDLKLRFDHYVATEAGFDGGQVEISVNGAAFQLVPTTNYLFNAPNGTFDAAPTNTNPNESEDAWLGTNSGGQAGSWGTTIADLSSLAGAGDTIKLRFTFSQDGCNGVEGWFVDNIRVYSCPTLEAPVLSIGADYQDPDPDGKYTFTWTRPTGATGPDVLQESSVCAPLLNDDASNMNNWTAANGPPDALVKPMWQAAPAGVKPNHNSASFWANPVSEQETQNTFATLTYNNSLQIPSTGVTTLSFDEWYFNEDDDAGVVEVSEDNGATWIEIYSNHRPMGDLPDAGATAFAEEGLTRKNINLTPFSGKTLQLRFRYSLGVSNFFLFVQYGWYIDNISIVSDAFETIATTNNTSHTVVGRPNGSRCYRVRTTYTFGGLQVRSPNSNQVGANVQRIGPPPVNLANLLLEANGTPPRGDAFTHACRKWTGRVTLDAPAPSGGTEVSLTNTNPKASVPASVTVPEGATTATFVYTVAAVSEVATGVVSATAGDVTKVRTLTIRPIWVQTIIPSTSAITGGQSMTAQVRLECVAAPGDITIKLRSSDTSVATVPSQIVMPQGQRNKSFTIQTSPVSSTKTFRVKASSGGGEKNSPNITVNP